MAYQRKCPNWLQTFGEYSLPRCESPETFVLWSGLFTLACALRRQVKVGKKYLGSWECPPHMYIILVGEAGKVRKTTAANFGVDMLEDISFIKRGPDIVTQAKLLSYIAESPDNAIYLISEEFSDLIMKSGEDMFAFLTSLFDGKRKLEAGTISRDVEFATRPCVNMLAATTPQWINANMPEAIIGGGFASRVIFIQEDKVRQRRMYYRDVHEAKDYSAIRSDLVSDLSHIAETLSGDFELDPEAEIYMEDWYQKNADNPTSDYRLAGYYQRKPAHIHKVAMLLRVAESDELVLRKQDFINAIRLVEGVEANLPKVFSGVGKNPFTFDIQRIREYVISNEPVDNSELMSKFSASAEPWKLQELIRSLVAMGELIHYKNGSGHVMYASPEFTIKSKGKTGKAFDPNDIDTWHNI